LLDGLDGCGFDTLAPGMDTFSSELSTAFFASRSAFSFLSWLTRYQISQIAPPIRIMTINSSTLAPPTINQDLSVHKSRVIFSLLRQVFLRLDLGLTE